MNKKIINIIESLSNEKSISIEKIFITLKNSISKVIKKKYNNEYNIIVKINRKFGQILIFRRWIFVKKIINPKKEISIQYANINFKNILDKKCIDKKIKKFNFDRISIQKIKKLIFIKMKESKIETYIKYFKKNKGTIVTGIVKIVRREKIIIELKKKYTGIIKKKEMLIRENLRPGDIIRGILYSLNNNLNKHNFLISRSSNKMLIELLKKEVPEIKEKIIEIKAITRYPGLRSKIAVKTNDNTIDPIGACIGLRGSRIQAISNELCGEKIDIFLWNESKVQLLINSISTIGILSIIMDSKNNKMDIALDKSYIAQAIGKNGQNVKLASNLTGFKLNIMTFKELYKKNKKIFNLKNLKYKN
ncbi:MAG: transcription termination factor NusA [Candidatus Makana argininalis]